MHLRTSQVTIPRIMKKRLAIIGLLLVVAAGGVGGIYWALTPTPGVTVENFRRLHRGMRLEEVETILSTNWTAPVPKSALILDSDPRKKWKGETCEIELHFWGWGDGAQLVKGSCQTSVGRSISVARVPLTLF